MENLKRVGFIFPSMFCFSFKSAANGCDCGLKLVLQGSMGSFLSYLRVAYVRANCITEYKDRNDRRLGRFISCKEGSAVSLSVCLSECLSVCLSVCVSVYWSVCQFIWNSICSSVHPSIHPSVLLAEDRRSKEKERREGEAEERRSGGE